MLLTKTNNTLPSLFNHFFEGELFNHERIAPNSFSVPAVNIMNFPERYEIDLAAPGMKKDQFQINLDRNSLKISAEFTNENREEENNHYSRREFQYGSFTRNFTLPEGADVENISAKYSDGILKVSIPKSEKEKAITRKIEIH